MLYLPYTHLILFTSANYIYIIVQRVQQLQIVHSWGKLTNTTHGIYARYFKKSVASVAKHPLALGMTSLVTATYGVAPV